MANIPDPDVDDDPTEESKRPALLFHHNVIEHLGIKLYQNRPVNVLSELVANSWDADAKRVWVEVNPGSVNAEAFMSVADEGSGMDFHDINERYLVVGKAKRKNPKDKSPGGRPPMGRKGIGKLAPFGIARQVQVVTAKDGLLNWFTLDLDGLRKAGADGRYEPSFPLENVKVSAVQIPAGHPFGEPVKKFLSRLGSKKCGTLVLMSGLTTNDLPTRSDIVKGLANRFTVVLARDDFKVLVEGKKISANEALPQFELRIPQATGSFATETVNGKKVQFWAGFFATADVPTDEAGVGVFVHGKIAQDRPFFFRSIGKEVFQRYLYAVVEADWLDELDDDLVSTDRTSINWDAPAAVPLAEWGKSKVNSWLTQYTDHRKGKHRGETNKTAERLRKARTIPTFSPSENEVIVSLVADATGDLPKSQIEKKREDLFVAVAKAWTNEPARELVKKLWDDVGSGGVPSDQFESVLRRLENYSVPESMSLALTFAQRAYALTVLTDVINHRSEENLQDLIEAFPWIIEPQGDLLTSDQQLKTTIERAAEKDDGGSKHDSAQAIQNISDKDRADFVFLTSAGEKIIRIVEIKAPGRGQLNRSHERQLVDYLDFVQDVRPNSRVDGLLIGNNGAAPNTYSARDTRVSVKGWDDVLQECRAVYVHMLVAMLHGSGITADDDRLAQVQRFAGKPVWDLLGKIAEKDTALAKLMAELDHLVDPQAKKFPVTAIGPGSA